MTTFIGIIDRPETLTIDSYSSAKTLNGVMHDIARLMKGICPRETKGFMWYYVKKKYKLNVDFLSNQWRL